MRLKSALLLLAVLAGLILGVLGLTGCQTARGLGHDLGNGIVWAADKSEIALKAVMESE